MGNLSCGSKKQSKVLIKRVSDSKNESRRKSFTKKMRLSVMLKQTSTIKFNHTTLHVLFCYHFSSEHKSLDSNSLIKWI